MRTNFLLFFRLKYRHSSIHPFYSKFTKNFISILNLDFGVHPLKTLVFFADNSKITQSTRT